MVTFGLEQRLLSGDLATYLFFARILDQSRESGLVLSLWVYDLYRGVLIGSTESLSNSSTLKKIAAFRTLLPST
jgi:hypothetical protein